MKHATVCGHTLWVPDNVADWDAVAGDSPWEKERMDSIIEHMGPDKVLYDIGAEHGWMSAIFAWESGCKLVLVEPTHEFWPNIKGCWDYNALPYPIATAVAFCSDKGEPGTDGAAPSVFAGGWPPQARGFEVGGRDYYHLQHPRIWGNPPTLTVDFLSLACGKPPDGLTIDVEGAELLVLKGAKATLEHDRPLVWVSIHDDLMQNDFGHHPDQLHGYMISLGYKSKLLRIDHEKHVFFWPEEVVAG